MKDCQRPHRIVSFLPSATEMIYALGLADRLVGVTLECDYPSEVRAKPVVVRCAVDLEGRTPDAIDRIVRERLRMGASLYAVDERLLRALSPDLIVAQDLCEVCAPSGNEVVHVLKTMPNPPDVLYMASTTSSTACGNWAEARDVTRRPKRSSHLPEVVWPKSSALLAPRQADPGCFAWSGPIPSIAPVIGFLK